MTMVTFVSLAAWAEGGTPDAGGEVALDGPIVTAWKKYVEAEPSSAAEWIDERGFTAFFLNAIPPRSDFARQVVAVGEEHFGEHGRVLLRVGTWDAWLVFRRGPEGRYRLTMDEKPILDALTRGWRRTQVGPFTYHSPRTLTVKQKREAQEMTRTFARYQKLFGGGPKRVDYYLAPPGPEAQRVTGESNPGAGQARVRLIRAVDTALHPHELVHVFALELAGFSTPFLDEGLATSLAGPPAFSEKGCESARGLIAKSHTELLDGSRFSQAQRSGENVYGVARLAVDEWRAKHGLPSVLNAVRAIAQGEPAAAVLTRAFGEPGQTDAAIAARLESACAATKP
jgi:hypothetical protein